MMESKKGDISERIFEYVLAAFIIAIIIAFIYLAVKFVMEKQCSSKINIFREDLKASLYSLGENDISEKKYFIGCNIDKIYFFDREKNISPERFAKMPVLKDIIESKPKGNVLLMKNDKVFSTMDAGNFRLDYPYYLCSKPSGGLFKLLLYWTKGTSRIKNKENNLDCTYVPVYPTGDEANNILNDCKKDNVCSSDKTLEFLNGIKDNTEILRKFECDENQNKMKVKILIKPNEGKYVVDFDYIEKIPKDCVNEILDEAINAPPGAVKSFKSDPLIMWHFSDLKEETEFYYELETCLSDECKEAIEGLGIGSVQDDTVPIDNYAPHIKTISILSEINVGEEYSANIEAEDPDGDSLTFSLEGAPNGISIDQNTGLISGVPSNSGDFNMKVTVNDINGGTGSENFPINVLAPLIVTLQTKRSSGTSMDFECSGEGGKSPYTYLWFFDDTLYTGSTTQPITYDFQSIDEHNAKCNVTDAKQDSVAMRIDFKIEENGNSNSAPKITIISPLDNQEFSEGQKIGIKGSVEDADENLYGVYWNIDGGGWNEVSFDSGGDGITGGTIYNIENYQKGDRKLRKQANISIDTGLGRDNLKAGAHTIRVKAVDSKGLYDEEAITIIIKNNPPNVNLISRNNTLAGREMEFLIFCSDLDGKISSCNIDYGDGTYEQESNVNDKTFLENKSHTYNQAGTYTATLTAKDNDGYSVTDRKTINVIELGSPPPDYTEIEKATEEKIFYINYSDYNKDFLDYGYGNEFNDELSKYYVLIAADSHGEAVDFVYSAKLINSAFIDTSVCCKNKMDFGCTDNPYFLKQETYHDYVVIGVGISETNGKKIEWVHACKLKGPVEIDYTKCCKDDASYGCIGKKPRENYVVVGFDSDMEDDDDGRSMAWVQTCKIVPKTTI